MADTLRIRGQEVQVRISQGGALLRSITAIENLTFTLQVDVLKKGYLGETTERRDDIYKGVALEFSFDPESSDGVALLNAIRDRASRRVAQSSVRINVTFVLNFPNGQRVRVTIADMRFQNPSIRVQGRDSYVSQQMSGESEDYKTVGV